MAFLCLGALSAAAALLDSTAVGAPKSRPAGEAAMLCQAQVGTGQDPSFCFFLVVNISPQPIRGPGLAMHSGFVLPELSLGNAELERPPQPMSVAALQHGDAAGLFVSLTDCVLRRLTAWV